ncbi:MAG: VOC family protein [Anaerolineae bacterium]
MKILETALYVDDLDAAKAFYTQLLGFRLYSEEPGRHLFLAGADAMLLLFNAEVTAHEVDGMVPSHGAIGPGHVAFQIEPGEIAAYEQLLEFHQVEIEKRVTFGNGITSIYFRDPAGNSLEFATRALWGRALNQN